MLISGFTIFGFSFHKIYIHFKSTEKTKNNLKKNDAMHKMERIPIFDEDFIQENELSELLLSDSGGKESFRISENKIEKILKSLIKEKLQKVFLKKGWDFKKLNGKIYYEILNKTIEIQVEWKNNFFGSNSDFYDRFSLKFL